jgi:hypothetical protein
MMTDVTKIQFTESMAEITKFCFELFYGHLNLYDDPLTDEGLKRIDYKGFGLDTGPVVAFADWMHNGRYELSCIKATDIDFVRDGGFPVKKTRRVELFAKRHGATEDELVASFSITADYHTGEYSNCWLPWKVWAVTVMIENEAVDLVRRLPPDLEANVLIWAHDSYEADYA